MPSFFKRNKKAPQEDAPPATAQSQDVPDLPAGMSQRRPDAAAAAMPYMPRNPSNLSFGGPVYQSQVGAADLRKQPRPFKSYRLRGEYVLRLP